MANNSNLHVCVDHKPQTPATNTLLSEQNLKSVYHAFKEREDNVRPPSSPAVALADGGAASMALSAEYKGLTILREVRDERALLTALASDKHDVAQLGLFLAKRWMPGKHLTVRFLEGTPLQQEKVKQYAVQWSLHANIHFDFVNAPNALIRVAFKEGAGSWSTVGTDCLIVTDPNEATMNFGWFTPNTKEDDYERTIVHEFGHAIGCVHEQSSPRFNLTWNKDYVYRWYWEQHKWDKTMVDQNVFERYTAAQVAAPGYDPLSIMQYPIPKEFTREGVEIGLNTKLSAADIAWVEQFYPFS
jgi:serralysin